MSELQCDWTVPANPSELQAGHETKPRPNQDKIRTPLVMSRGDESEDDMLILLSYSTCDLLFSGVCLRGCKDADVPTCRLVLRSSPVSVCTGDRLHTELFVAGLAPWELILHLSIPHSRAPDFTPNLPAADPFSQWYRGPHYHSHCLLYSLARSSLAYTPIFTLHALLRAQRWPLSHPHTFVCDAT